MSKATQADVTLKGECAVEKPRRECKVAYLVSRFPKLTETFVLCEMLAVEKLGIQIELYPLLRERSDVMHVEAARMVQRAHYQPFLSWRFVPSHLHFLTRKPHKYAGALWSLLRGTWGSFRYFAGALAIFPKAVYLAGMIQAQGVTRVHAHFANHPTAAAFVIHRLTGIPYSFTTHGSDVHCDRHMLREKVAEAVAVVTVSEEQRELIIDECGDQVRNKVGVIHTGIDTDKFAPPSEDRRSHETADPFNVLCIGTMHEVKGQTFLIEACRRLRERGSNIECHLVGDGPDKSSLAKQVAEADLAGRVHFHGCRTRDEIARLLKRMDILAAPSVPTKDGRREGIPNAIKEAMASGVPVVASDSSGIPELVKDNHNGLLVPPGDPEALANAMDRLTTEPALRRRLARAARNSILRHFDVNTNAANLARLLREEVAT